MHHNNKSHCQQCPQPFLHLWTSPPPSQYVLPLVVWPTIACPRALSFTITINPTAQKKFWCQIKKIDAKFKKLPKKSFFWENCIFLLKFHFSYYFPATTLLLHTVLLTFVKIFQKNMHYLPKNNSE